MPNPEGTSIFVGGHQFPVSIATAKLLYLSDQEPSPTYGVAVVKITADAQYRLKYAGPNTDEPSVVFTRLPVKKPDDVRAVPEIGYYPAYARCSPEQRWIYLNWLRNTAEPIHISYVFIYYYGLERRLLTDEFDLAFAEILRLREHHHHPSFVGYNSNALLQSCILQSRIDRLRLVRFPATRREEKNKNLFAAYVAGAQVAARDLMAVARYIRGLPKRYQRYVESQPTLFESVLTGLLTDVYGVSGFPIARRYKRADLPVVGDFVFANYSFPDGLRKTNIPDFYSYAPFTSEVAKLFDQTHEMVKRLLQQQRGR